MSHDVPIMSYQRIRLTPTDLAGPHQSYNFAKGTTVFHIVFVRLWTIRKQSKRRFPAGKLFGFIRKLGSPIRIILPCFSSFNFHIEMTYLTDPDEGDIPIFSHAWAAPGVVSEGGGDLESAHLASWRNLSFDDRHDPWSFPNRGYPMVPRFGMARPI